MMNVKYLTAICAHFNLGTALKPPTRVHGGLLHTMWRVDTDKATYAVKQLSRDINLTDENIIKNYELSEQIASRFITLGIPGVSAIEQSGKYLFIIGDVGFLVYPWVEAKALASDIISEKHALKMAAILAAMHKLNLDVPEIVEPKFAIHTNKKIIELIDKSENFACDFSDELIKHKNAILAANAAYQNAISILKNHIVVSHGDLDQKNVLWDKNDNPILIDWESARKLNPTYDIVGAGLDWSGMTGNNFNKALFIKMIQVYQASGSIVDKAIFEASFYGVLGNWLNWMVYNIERACTLDETDQKKLGVDQVSQTLSTILRLQAIISELIKNVSGNLGGDA